MEQQASVIILDKTIANLQFKNKLSDAGKKHR